MNTPSRRSDQLISALPSALSKRTKPSVPPSSATFDPLIKHALTRRFTRNILAVSAIAAWFAAVLWTPWIRNREGRGGVLGLFINALSARAVMQAAGLWIFGSVPIAVIRRVHIKMSRSSALSPYQAFTTHLSQSGYKQALFVFIASALLVTSWHTILSQAGQLGIWAGSKKHPFHLNGRLLYIFLAQFCAASVYWFADLLKDRFTVHWNRHAQINSSTLLPHVIAPVASSIFLSSTSTLLSLVAFAVLRMAVLPIVYRLPVLHGILRPFIAHFLRPTMTLTFLWTNFDVVLRAGALAFTTLFMWDLTSALFAFTYSAPSSVSESHSDPLVAVVSGVATANPYFQHHAFNELCSLSADSSRNKDRRVALFADSKYQPSLWASVVRQSLLLLGHDYQLFLRRGNPPAAPPAAPPPAAAKRELVQSTIKTSIYKPATPSPVSRLVDALSSNSPVNDTLAQVVDRGLGIGFDAGAQIQGSSLSSSVKKVESSLTASVKKLETTANDALAVISPMALITKAQDALKLKGLDIWWMRPRKDREAYKALPNKDLDIMIVEALSTLVARSLQEDAFGNVQRDIPKILEALISFLLSLEEYHAELSTTLATLRTDQATAKLAEVGLEINRAEEWVDQLAAAIRTGIALIVHEFDDRLMSFRFPPKIASKLQNFVDYST